MQTTPKPKRASTDTAKPRRTEAKRTPDGASAKPRREGGTKAVDSKPAPSARRAPATRHEEKTSARGNATPRQTENKAPARGNAVPRQTDKTAGRGNPAPRTGGKPAAKSKIAPAPVAPPRRVGTKMSRLLDLNVAPPVTQKPHAATSNNGALTHWLLYCRPGFEQDCTQEAVGQARRQRPVLGEQPGILPNSGYALVAINGQSLAYSELIFSRQLICLHHIIEELPERDRLTPILSAIAALPGTFGTLWLEVPDTNDGKTLTAFTRRFQPLLETALRELGRLVDTDPAESRKLPRLHIFFPDKSAALIGTSDPYNSADALMGISRQSMPAEAPSRSTLKLAEAIDVFMDKGEQSRLLRSGMTAVDLGAAPGGWTWQMVKRGMRVTAVDNGPMKGVLAKNPAVEHLMQDGFKFTPRKAVDWLICDMVEKPDKVAELIGKWFVSGWCKHAIFNLKLPMKQRITATDAALGGIRKQLDMEGISYKLIAKQLYHDREEITVFLSKTKNR